MPNSLEATFEHRGELDEIFLPAERVHIERMNNRAFWIGVDLPGGGRVNINTGVVRGEWFFNVEHDEAEGSFYSVTKPATYRRNAR